MPAQNNTSLGLRARHEPGICKSSLGRAEGGRVVRDVQWWKIKGSKRTGLEGSLREVLMCVNRPLSCMEKGPGTNSLGRLTPARLLKIRAIIQ